MRYNSKTAESVTLLLAIWNIISTERHTILSVAAAPRDVRRKQEKFGTGGGAVTLMRSAEDVLERRRQIDSRQNGHAGNSALPETSSVPAKRFKTTIESGGAARKKKVAPLMAKTLKMLKQARR